MKFESSPKATNSMSLDAVDLDALYSLRETLRLACEENLKCIWLRIARKSDIVKNRIQNY